jgi:uncharacterized protein (DUF1501 family)
MMPSLRLTRRSALLGLTSALTLGRASLAFANAATEQRLVVVILRGAMDGLSAVVPYGDRSIAELRGELVPAAPGQPDGLLDLGGFYGLHPDLTGLHAMYKAGELLPVHAVAGHYRTRSHFEGQDYLESGADQRMTSGWLNRVASQLPRRPAGEPDIALAMGMSTPQLLRGPFEVANWVPHNYAGAAPDLFLQLASLYRNDPLTGPAFDEGMHERGYAAGLLGKGTPPRPGSFASLAEVAGRFLAAADGPRLAALELDGWDTHMGQEYRLRVMMRQLDAGMAALKTSLGPAWRQTAVLTMTEFGRTVRQNGTKGTDHGTGTVAFVLGGAVNGGRVQADWPGLAPAKLLDNRDLMPTVDLRSVAKGLLADHIGLPPAALGKVFPDSADARPMGKLVRT